MLHPFRPVVHALRVAQKRPTFFAPSVWVPLKGLRFASSKAYTEDHEWILYDASSKIGIVGITEYAQKSLGDVVFVELPSVGSEVKKQDQIGAVESVKAASDIFAPVSGIIETINSALGDQPALLNRSPEDAGWLCKIKLSDAEEIRDLMDAEGYKAHCEGKT
ncbi:MAG: hypothetical protein CYPHOPRED_000351 [Cyphobasidiales sp. Tagirdzhanova-0007]|nr:MAG: hypothetical protein CYPHOPRED_000351 [Cyphobasidiales sp. Tagirdzhanova-0007]